MSTIDDRLDLNRYEQLIRKAFPGSRLLRAWQVHGGVSAQVAGLEVEEDDGTIRKLIVRRHGTIDVVRNPNIAVDEFRLLNVLKASGLPVPVPITVDQSHEICPGPVIMVEYIEGETEVEPSNLSEYLAQSALNLARIHAIDHIQAGLSFLPEEPNPMTMFNTHLGAVELDPSVQEWTMRAVSAARALPARNPHCLLYGDFWSGNLLWRDGTLVGIIDWENAAIGDPLADLAMCRLEFLCTLGPAAMMELTERYFALAPIVDATDLPAWDLSMASKMASKFSAWGLDEQAETAIRAHINQFIDQATDALSGQHAT